MMVHLASKLTTLRTCPSVSQQDLNCILVESGISADLIFAVPFMSDTMRLQLVLICNFLRGADCKAGVTKLLVYLISLYRENYALVNGMYKLGQPTSPDVFTL